MLDGCFLLLCNIFSGYLSLFESVLPAVTVQKTEAGLSNAQSIQRLNGKKRGSYTPKHLLFSRLLAALDALLYSQPPHLLHEQEDLVPPCTDVHADLLQLQLRKVLQDVAMRFILLSH